MLYFPMGQMCQYQPLTKEDRITVVLYRAGIVLSALVLAISAFMALKGRYGGGLQDYPFLISGLGMNILLLTLYFSVGLSVFFIHLYVGKFYRTLKKIYFIAVVCLGILFFIGHGNPVMPFFRTPSYSALLLLPLSLCLGFVTAKEAFCFKLFEGYLLAVIMPMYLFFYAVGVATQRGIVTGLAIVASLLVFFTVRKVFMPLHCDIGDKSAYQQ
ncbi:MAG: hypothetical protein HZA17_11745 [Nitrospirae bacterium]|nr:hypothetical protein [Nitrospirota bacterium]